jgi:DNA-binding transcriptional LysR family regulator
MNMTGLNLNLLLTLDALLAERHVSRAARRLGLSQPAVSNALGQLRTWLGDPLLVRTGSTMVPTERALALAGPVRAALESLQSALKNPAFDPARAERSFAVATTDFVEFVMLPRLLARVAGRAPGIRFQVVSWPHHRVPGSLETGEVDLWIGFSLDVPRGHRQQDLFPEEFVCILRKDHPKVGKRLSLKTYASLPHVLVTSDSEGPGVVDVALAKVNMRRTVGLRMSHFLMVPAVVAATDYVAAISPRVAAAFAPLLPLRVLPAPLPLPRGTVKQVWHERTDASLAHRWLRAEIAAVARTLPA